MSKLKVVNDITKKQEKALVTLFDEERAAVLLAYGRANCEGRLSVWLEEMLFGEILDYWYQAKEDNPEADFKDRLILDEFCQIDSGRDTTRGTWESDHPDTNLNRVHGK